jgi:hypothetical protein
MRNQTTAGIGAALVLCAAPIFAQSQEAGQVEVAAFAGGSYLRVHGDGETKGAFGGRVGATTGGPVTVFGEFSYYPFGDVTSIRALRGCPQTACPGGGFLFRETRVNGGLWDFSGGVHVTLARAEWKAAPYLLGALGAGHASADGSFDVVTGGFANRLRIHASDTAFGLSGGGGLRYFAGPRWGIQPELRYTRYFFEDAGLNNLRFSMGVFFRFGK